MKRIIHIAAMAAALLALAACSSARPSPGAPPPGQPASNQGPYPYAAPPADAKMAEMPSSSTAKGMAESPPPGSMQRSDQSAPAAVTGDDAEADMASESYASLPENAFKPAAKSPLSTFSIDVDTASYANARRYIEDGYLPPPEAVRIEEMVNYFDYSHPDPEKGPIGVRSEIASCPWAPGHRLLMVGVQARRVPMESLPAANFVFLLDVSGSMSDPDKLPLLQKAFTMLVDQLRPQDTVAITVYAGAAGTVLEPTSGDKKAKILAALDGLSAGGSTAGGAGIKLAYSLARKNLKPGGNNRVILATDGDFNVGTTNDNELNKLIETYRKDGIYLTVLGFGTGNVKDSRMETLADKGQGNYAYIDSVLEARKVLVTQMGGTLLTVAKDVKIQVEFNQAAVKAYRLIGYENRMLATRDFEDDTKDAGEIGAGHTVTALYELIPASSAEAVPPGADPQERTEKPTVTDWAGPETARVRIRFKAPESERSELLEFRANDGNSEFGQASTDFRFAGSVAAFGLVLRGSINKGTADFDMILAIAKQALGRDLNGYRAGFIELVGKAKALKR
ncbi:MAG: VWA domain-containing protein [Spirochaetes bacterium]|nr:VWA domain-containing protein [Spirochaetota bacterium]